MGRMWRGGYRRFHPIGDRMGNEMVDAFDVGQPICDLDMEYGVYKVPRSTTCYREARPLSANSSFCVAYVEPPLRSFELSEKEACLTECGILESTEPPLNLVESSQRSSLSERVRPFAKTLGLFQLTGAARPLSFFMVAQGLLFLFPGERIT